MATSILEFLGIRRVESAPRSSGDSDTVRRIVDALDRMDAERARFLAAFAYILSRVARADLDVSRLETATMERILVEQGRLPEEQAVLVVHMAKAQNALFGGTENFLVTREFEKLASREDKLLLLECLFAVSAADENITTTEDNEVRRIASELKLDHRDFIESRTAFTRFLSVLRDRKS